MYNNNKRSMFFSLHLKKQKERKSQQIHSKREIFGERERERERETERERERERKKERKKDRMREREIKSKSITNKA